MPPDLPSIKSFLFPILQLLVEAGRPLDRQTIARGAADKLGLSDEQRAIRIPSGKHFTYRHRSGWSLQELKHAGLVARTGPNAWAATPHGRDFLGAHTDGFTQKELAPLKQALGLGKDTGDGELEVAGGGPDGPDVDLGEAEDEGTPREIIEQAIAAMRASLAAELAQRLQECEPTEFEQIVLDVLHKSGYGATRDSLKLTPASGDGGIDGIISLDRLGLEKVYVQAKRWKTSVGRPELQSFFGALSGRKARKGVFITTSDFTAGAREYAHSVSDTLRLVSGAELVRLMIECRVGVKEEAITIPEFDAEYFADE